MSACLDKLVSGLLTYLAQNAALQNVLGSPARIQEEGSGFSAFPYLVLSSVSEKETGAKGLSLQAVDLGFKVVSRAKTGHEARAVLVALREALHDASVVIEGVSVVAMREEQSTCQWSVSRAQYEGAARYVAKVTELA